MYHQRIPRIINHLNYIQDCVTRKAQYKAATNDLHHLAFVFADKNMDPVIAKTEDRVW